MSTALKFFFDGCLISDNSPGVNECIEVGSKMNVFSIACARPSGVFSLIFGSGVGVGLGLSEARDLDLN